MPAIADVSIAVGTPYSLSLQIRAGTASLTANGTPRVSFSYGTNLTIGFVGLGTRNALANFGTMRAQ